MSIGKVPTTWKVRYTYTRWINVGSLPYPWCRLCQSRCITEPQREEFRNIAQYRESRQQWSLDKQTRAQAHGVQRECVVPRQRRGNSWRGYLGTHLDRDARDKGTLLILPPLIRSRLLWRTLTQREVSWPCLADPSRKTIQNHVQSAAGILAGEKIRETLTS